MAGKPTGRRVDHFQSGGWITFTAAGSRGTPAQRARTLAQWADAVPAESVTRRNILAYLAGRDALQAPLDGPLKDRVAWRSFHTGTWSR
jgi:hypothetical protein